MYASSTTIGTAFQGVAHASRAERIIENTRASPDGSTPATCSRWRSTTVPIAHEIRSPKDLDLPKAGEGWTKKEMDLAHRLIDTLADKWKPEDFRDTYTEVLRKAIEAKIEGKELELPREEREQPVANLMKALEQSLARKEPAKAAGRTAKGPQKRRAGKRAA